MKSPSVPSRPAVLITGGSGFLGRALISELMKKEPLIDASEIRIFDINDMKTEAPSDPRLVFLRGDIRDKAALEKACSGIDIVFHSAAIVDWGTHSSAEVYDINTGGTQNALEAAMEAGTSAFIYTSSLDAVITGKPLRMVDESLPYPSRHPNAYCGSKAAAEKIVLAANDNQHMRTVVIRPSSVWGPGDPYHISALVEMARKGRYARIGDGKARQQHIYVGNLAHGHLQAAHALVRGSEEEHSPAGKAYFLTDSQPENFFSFFDRIVEGAGFPIPPKSPWIPQALAFTGGVLAETVAAVLRPVYRWNPKISRFAVRYTCNEFTFNSSRAASDFGFKPLYDFEEALATTTLWFRDNICARIPKIPVRKSVARDV